MKKRVLTEEEIKKIINLYQNDKKTVNNISAEMHLNKTKIYKVLFDNNVTIRKRGELLKQCDKDIIYEHFKILKYVPNNEYTYVAVLKDDNNVQFSDFMNKSGCLSKYIKEKYNIKPLSNYKSYKYYYQTKNYWWEEWFNIVKVEIPKKNVIELDNNIIISKYLDEKMTVDTIASKFHVGKKKIYKILKDNNIELRKKGELKKKLDFTIKSYKNNVKYIENENSHYIAVSKFDGNVFNDYMNRGGHLTSYIKNKLNIEIPSSYEMKKYFMQTNDYWWEQWFEIKEVKDNYATIQCPYCDWRTIDVDNKSGTLSTHIKKCHHKTYEDICSEFPSYKDFFKSEMKLIERKEKLCEKENYIICPICNEKLEMLTKTHIENKHRIKYEDFINMYPNCKLISDRIYQINLENAKKCNLTVSKNRFISKYELELQSFLNSYNIEFETNRQILTGKEIDILIPSKMVGIEFDGLYFHSEWRGGKSHTYHRDKTDECLNKGYSLIHIFEDEFVNHKDIVLNKLKHILKLDNNLPRIMGRKCEIKEIYKNDAKIFLNKYHIQSYTASSVYIGAFYNNELIAVMSFKKGNIGNPNWELTRFASNYNYICQGVGGKLFKYFIKHYNPSYVVSFADRRWTFNSKDNLYIKLGFELEKITPPDYKYYNCKINKYKRFHKMFYTKNKLSKLYGFPLTMTEKEMAIEAGFDRIWDCGLFKYVWKNDE